MDLIAIRRLIMVGIASDDVLMDLLVLKGGNALELIHRIGGRASVDLDYSMEGEFEDLAGIEARLWSALRDRFDAVGLVMFDTLFGPRPSSAGVGARWGGYRATFKLAPRELVEKLGANLEKLRRQSHVADPEHGRIFKVDISRYEYCGGAVQNNVDEYLVRAYTPEMIAVEKLRAVCQQMAGFAQRRHPAPRPRDFYDIFSVATATGMDFLSSGNLDLLRNIFAAKEVPVELLRDVEGQCEFHRTGWDSVVNAVQGKIEPFDFYFEYVLTICANLCKALGVV